jgi:hypothetical protein
VSATRTANRRLTQRNLHATLGAIDRQQPEKSPLLVAPIQPHGTAKAAVFTSRDASQYQELVDWVYQVTSNKPAPRKTKHKEPAASKRDPVAPPAVDDSESENESAEADEPTARAFGQLAADSPDSQSTGPGRPTPRTPKGSVPKRGTPPDDFTPQDPFDPEIFNRRAQGK